MKIVYIEFRYKKAEQGRFIIAEKQAEKNKPFLRLFFYKNNNIFL